jgi:acetyl-CoA carboxylase biotin carboxyl carrier protein
MAASKKKAPRKAPTKRATRGNDKLHTDQVRQFVALMVENDLTSLEIVNGDLKVSLGRGVPVAVPEAASISPTVMPTSSGAQAEAGDVEELVSITSPMVGTFYSAPSPDSEEFVDVGMRVTPETVVCIVEAMKVMNEIKADCSGTVVEIVATNGQPVEYGQVLYCVKP